MTAKKPWFRKHWAPHRGRFRYVPIVWQGWVALLATIAAPQLIWFVSPELWPHPLLRIPASIAILLIALWLLFRVVKDRSSEAEPR